MISARLQQFRRLLGKRVVMALADQGAVSIASFGTGMLLSRAFGLERREELGLYYLAVTISILIGEVQNALVSTPHTVTAPTLEPAHGRRFNGSSLIHHFALSLVITVLLLAAALAAPAMGIRSHEPMLLACAVTAVAVGLRNFARFFNFALHRPHIACLGDYVVTAVQLCGIGLLWRENLLSAWSAVAVIGLASLVGGGLMLALSRGDLQPSLSLAWADFGNNWRLSRWVFASGLIGNAGVGFYPWIIDRLSNTLQTAVFGNCSTVSSAGNPVLNGLQNWIAPSISHAFARDRGAPFRRHVFRSAAFFLILLPPILLMLALITNPLLHHLYQDYSANTLPLVMLLSCGSVLATTSFVISRGLYSFGRGELDVWANAVPVVILLTVGWPLVRYHGAIGAAISLLIAQVLGLLVRGGMFWAITSTPRRQVARHSALPLSSKTAVNLGS